MQNLAPFEAHLFTLWGTLFHKRPQTISKDFPPELVLDWIDGPQVWSLLGMGPCSLKCTDQIWQNPIRMAAAAQKQFGCYVGLSRERRELEQKFQLF